MEKLIELLNQFEKETKSGYTWKDIDSYDNCVYGVDCDGETEIVMYSDLYSKCYGFIQRLVEQDKIELEAGPLYGCQLIMHNRQPYTLYETLLMLLAISDTPIEDLISYLK